MVFALNYRGYPTYMSCEGHSLSYIKRRMRSKVLRGTAKLVEKGERGLRYLFLNDEDGEEKCFYESPWVDVDIDVEKAKELIEIVNLHNSREKINWDIFAGYFSYRINGFPIDNIPWDKLVRVREYRLHAVPEYDLKEMQSSISIFARNILNS